MFHVGLTDSEKSLRVQTPYVVGHLLTSAGYTWATEHNYAESTVNVPYCAISPADFRRRSYRASVGTPAFIG